MMYVLGGSHHVPGRKTYDVVLRRMRTITRKDLRHDQQQQRPNETRGIGLWFLSTLAVLGVLIISRVDSVDTTTRYLKIAAGYAALLLIFSSWWCSTQW